MQRPDLKQWTRLSFLRAAMLAPAAALIAACTGKGSAGTSPPAASDEAIAPPPAAGSSSATSVTAGGTALRPVLQATPECGDDDDDPTPAQTEGPYFTPNSPERTSLLEAGMGGERLTISGYVVNTACQPIAGALIDFWQCDDAGEYDNVGYRLRGHQFTDDQGRYFLETILPGIYTGRTRHIHVKVQAPGGRVLTTQQYFPDEPRNARDGIYRPELVMDVQDTPDGKAATFTYVLNVA